jgi:hypothetical protein
LLGVRFKICEQVETMRAARVHRRNVGTLPDDDQWEINIMLTLYTRSELELMLMRHNEGRVTLPRQQVKAILAELASRTTSHDEFAETCAKLANDPRMAKAIAKRKRARAKLLKELNR